MKSSFIITQTMAIKNLKHRSVRTWCMIFFVFMLSVALFFSSVLVDSMTDNLQKTTDRLGADIIVVPKEYEKDMADSLFMGELCNFNFDRKWENEIKNIEGIKQSTPQLYMASLAADCCSSATQMIVFDPDTDFIIKPWLEKDGLALPKKGELYIGCSIDPPEPDTIKFFGENYKVIGKLEKTNTSYDTCVFMTSETAQEIMDSDGWKAAFNKSMSDADKIISSLMIRVEDGADAKTVARKINYSIKGAPISAYTTNGIFNGVMDSVKNMSGYSTTIMVLMLIMVITALISIFTITINERTSEFGILASLGISSGKLSGIVLTEGTVIGFLGGILGVATSVIILLLFSNTIMINLNIPRLNTNFIYLLSLGVKCLFLSVAVSILSSLYSVWKINRSKIDELIKGEEL
ncbi:ABC transporter permease [Clostridium tepidum]|jgi:putative ABC transport system permease protein|uniref:Putative hemin transport system permease protein HrtB n=1 Tax=Clostridium tepidum TaxID=1962263 RepID=A0ABX3L417_9CLOT|nr:FtsX-like permease family protein [Clostridium tepidum]MDU6877531.1 FtsX-like permease family protein [Clostridium botulinum]OOO62096.1 hypothetical protein BS637_08180 [Clostridium tepidum]